ncbi:MAG TPA: lysylphosphatidylglycerol synthase domain-containing protein [Archangium sp.]|uniref:lysylphosphatidylglycerol synthase domain-containing protein n=1 Tax=Archangium sp. TaxID=1872627 RepID=UPI002E377B67|nr:lysylphosphatidylglycerol synthase domain-containing protein [Archangium sp.]HEX5746183.1 lysylphosphatidylglycerol synthase domain-containing protein [Archangium sp.]
MLGGERQEWSLGALAMPQAARVLAVLHPVCAVLGVALLAVLVQRAGAEELGRLMAHAAPWLPLVLLLEVARLSLDAVATRAAYGGRAREVPWRCLLRAQLIGTAVASVAPAGRASGEAAKAALLSPYTGGATALAAAATSQAASLVAGGLLCLACTFAAYLRTGASWLTLVLGVHALGLLLVGLGMHAGMHGRALPPLGPLVASLLGRTLQAVQYGTLALAVGIDTTTVEALLAEGLHLVSLVVGALVPGEFGVREGAFALSAGAFGTTPARAMSVALLAHGTQGVFVLLGSLTPLVWKVHPPSWAPHAR